jgi:hypothetical protein
MIESKESPEIADFKEILIESVNSRNMAIREGVEVINLGKIGEEADALLRKSLDDKPEHRERGKSVYVSSDRKVFFPIKDCVGGSVEENGSCIKKSVTIDTALTGRVFSVSSSEHIGQQRFLGSIIHTHGDSDLPPSVADLDSLFISFSNRLETLSPSIIVATVSTKFTIFRGQNTPRLNEDIFAQKSEIWIRQMRERIRQFASGQSEDEKMSINIRVQSAMLFQIARKYDLKIFTCPSNQNIAIKSQ